MIYTFSFGSSKFVFREKKKYREAMMYCSIQVEIMPVDKQYFRSKLCKLCCWSININADAISALLLRLLKLCEARIIF